MKQTKSNLEIMSNYETCLKVGGGDRFRRHFKSVRHLEAQEDKMSAAGCDSPRTFKHFLKVVDIFKSSRVFCIKLGKSELF